MQAVEHMNIDGVDVKLFGKPIMIDENPFEAVKQWDCEMEKVNRSNGHIEVFAGTPENIEDRSKLSRQSRRRLERLEDKANKKRLKNRQ